MSYWIFELQANKNINKKYIFLFNTQRAKLIFISILWMDFQLSTQLSEVCTAY